MCKNLLIRLAVKLYKAYYILEIERINLQRREVNALIFQEQRHKADQLALETVPDLAKMISCIDTALKTIAVRCNARA